MLNINDSLFVTLKKEFSSIKKKPTKTTTKKIQTAVKEMSELLQH